MANAVYPLFKQSLLGADANSAITGSGTTGLYVGLGHSATKGYASTDQFYSALSGLQGTDQEITSPTLTNGLISGGNVTFSAVTASASAVDCLFLYRKNAGANTTWRLVAFIDTGVTGLPVTPNNGDITITWSGSGIIQL